VERLERCASPDAVIDAGPAPPEGAREARAVHAARPADVPRPVVLLGPLPLQHRLRAAVADLLLPVGAHGIPAVVPDERGRAEAEAPTELAQPPAHVHVVAVTRELGG